MASKPPLSGVPPAAEPADGADGHANGHTEPDDANHAYIDGGAGDDDYIDPSAPLFDLIRPPSPDPPSLPPSVADTEDAPGILGSIASALYSLLPGSQAVPVPPPLDDLLPPPAQALDDDTVVHVDDASRRSSVAKPQKESSSIMVYLRKRGVPTAEDVVLNLEDFPEHSDLAVALFPLLQRFIPQEMRGVTSPGQLTLLRLSAACTNYVFIVKCPPFPDTVPEPEPSSGFFSLFPRFKRDGRPASRKLILRIYGVGVDNFVQRERELVWMHRLSRMGVGPRIVGCFANGRLEEFVDSDTLTSPQMRTEEFSPRIAEQMARFHLIGSSSSSSGDRTRRDSHDSGTSSPRMAAAAGRDSPALNGRAPTPRSPPLPAHRSPGLVPRRTGTPASLKSPRLTALRSPTLEALASPRLDPSASPEEASEMWARLASWFAVAEGNAAELRLRGPEERAALEGFEGFDHWKKEVEWIRRMVGKLGSPIVFSHNDMQYGNVLKKKLDDSLVLVDYEYAGFNMRGYDIANHFCEWMYDYHLPRPHLMHTEWFPTPEQQRFYLSAYLRSYYRLFGAAAPDDLDGELDHLAAEVRLLELLVHVHWGLWGIMQAANRKRYDAGDEWEYDNLGYGMRRFAAYREKKGGVAEMLEGLGITDG